MLKSIKKIQVLIVIFIFVGLFSTGFAAWNIVDQVKNSVESSGAILVDSTEYISKYIHLAKDTATNKALTFFKFTDDGFINEGTTSSLDGYINAYFVVNINDCKAKFTESDSLMAEFTLKYKDSSAFKKFSIFTYDALTITPTITSGLLIDGTTQEAFVDLNPLITVTNKNSSEYSFTAKFDDLLLSTEATLCFKVTYKLSVLNKAKFLDVYNHLFNGGNLITFSLNAGIDGYSKGGN